ncbi:regulatory protein RecX [Glaciecola sp. MH2013]|uniref:regulatory protein RecX n=1 Tax=Glaciecola sp. MH2013 TaxID=2785524 RepID=UPI0018A11A40|nr:regulatory protein RecX [Glaciecola sp. MH2013]MBF7072405.1 regulatory protein RecX [Glaciecola sp. MH2013]
MSDSQAKIIRHKITRLLSRREHSAHEIRQKLLALNNERPSFRQVAKNKSQQQTAIDSSELDAEAVIQPELVDEILTQFIEKDIQSDFRYAEAVVRGAYRKGKGPLFIQRSLQEHDIDYALVKALIAEHDFDWFELAKTVREKRFGWELPQDWQAKQKQMRFLQYRGFEQEQIKYAFE